VRPPARTDEPYGTQQHPRRDDLYARQRRAHARDRRHLEQARRQELRPKINTASGGPGMKRWGTQHARPAARLEGRARHADLEAGLGVCVVGLGGLEPPTSSLSVLARAPVSGSELPDPGCQRGPCQPGVWRLCCHGCCQRWSCSFFEAVNPLARGRMCARTIASDWARDRDIGRSRWAMGQVLGAPLGWPRPRSSR
jgi:hypothetical protein